MSSLSVLKTSSSLKKKQTLKDGEELFRQQVRQMGRQEVFEKTLLVVSQHKRPIASVAVALLVGAVSIWLRKGANERFWSQILHTFESVTGRR